MKTVRCEWLVKKHHVPVFQIIKLVSKCTKTTAENFLEKSGTLITNGQKKRCTLNVVPKRMRNIELRIFNYYLFIFTT
jgi:hypothetical protein